MRMETVMLGVAGNQIDIHPLSPWLVALGAGLWFAWIAYRNWRGATLWGIGGGLLGLVLTTITIGLGSATAVPYSDPQRLAHRLWALAAAAAVIGLVGVGLILKTPRQRHSCSPQT